MDDLCAELKQRREALGLSLTGWIPDNGYRTPT